MLEVKHNASNDMFRKYNEQYVSEERFFLSYWMEKEGFKKVLDQVVNENSTLYIDKNINSIVNWTKIF